ncbi:RNA polymerase sigma-70 factor [Paraflavisolibacter sp. H34]|uniref:RNA polymerase sigma-70 factor n=1 Tax=Huijunlia imazamoxiresistens TaxID=3127457 RepID=UPI003018459D
MLSPDSPYHNDPELLAALSQGNEDALVFIYRKYWERLFLSAFNVLKDKEACEDIVQEIFIQLWQKRDRLTITVSLSAYLFTATRYQVFHALKKGAGRQELFEGLEERLTTDAPDVPLYVKDIQARVHAAVENLPEKCRNIYQLSREQHLSYKEIADRLQVSPKTVENQMTIALKKLREALGDLLFFLV